MTTWRLPITVASPAPIVVDDVVERQEVGGEEEAGERREPDRARGPSGRSAAARARPRGAGAAARTGSGTRRRSTATRRTSGRRSPRTRCAKAPSSAALRGKRASRSSGPASLSRGPAVAGAAALDWAHGGPSRASRGRRRTAGRARRTGPARAATAPRASGRVPDWVFGKAMTSRMFVWPAKIIAQRSMPSAIPPCGGAPYSNASRTAPNFSCIPSTDWPWRRNERSSRSRRWIRIEPPPSSQPLSARSYWSARARPAGSLGRRAGPGRRTRSRAAPRPRGATPLNGLCVASQRSFSASHWYIGKRWTQA